jgi:hypothetical protein
LPLDQQLAVREARVPQHRGAVAQRARDLAGLVERREPAVQVGRALEREHRGLVARDHDRVEAGHVDLRDLARLLEIVGGPKLAVGRVSPCWAAGAGAWRAQGTLELRALCGIRIGGDELRGR